MALLPRDKIEHDFGQAGREVLIAGLGGPEKRQQGKHRRGPPSCETNASKCDLTTRRRRLQSHRAMSTALRRRQGRPVQKEHLAGPLAAFVPAEVCPLGNPQTGIPRIARDPTLVQLIEESLRRIPAKHTLNLADARDMSGLAGRMCTWFSPRS